MPDGIKLSRLAKRMRDKNQVLCFCHGPEGAHLYWLEPSQRKVRESAAQRAISSGALIASDDGLFAGSSQTYRVAPEFAA